ncbi:DUF962 domain-containing protein [Sphingomonas parva]|uniref:DUF962 domain-containing protein n=1 Tax=Sphingomonas parva TaxID=2555898 RepID=A0A4Y8ZUF8_9SPHN|nr:DUF962 domain-containing protein [Sphingomonas parva]
MRLRRFADFWPHYLREHARPGTRALHYAGTALVILLAVGAVASGDLRLMAAVPIAGYGFAWASHLLVERNRPATFTHPLWSLGADFRMFFLWLSGRLGPELRKAGIAADGTFEAGDGA